MPKRQRPDATPTGILSPSASPNTVDVAPRQRIATPKVISVAGKRLPRAMRIPQRVCRTHRLRPRHQVPAPSCTGRGRGSPTRLLKVAKTEGATHGFSHRNRTVASQLKANVTRRWRLRQMRRRAALRLREAPSSYSPNTRRCAPRTFCRRCLAGDNHTSSAMVRVAGMTGKTGSGW